MPPNTGTVIIRGGSAGNPAAPDQTRRSLIDELDGAISGRNIASRADMLRRITDLFMAGAGRFDDAQRALFDDIMGRLVEEIDKSARAAFGARLAALANAPRRVSRKLALDDSIEVAGPLLTHSDQLDDDTLVAGARTKSQDHLLAISRRKLISECVTDVLVKRGDRQVVVSAAGNAGARFSEFGYSTLVTRSKDHDELALAVWQRPEVPRQHMLALFAAASDAVRCKFEALDRGKAAAVRDLVKRASDQVQTSARERSADFAKEQAEVEALHRDKQLTDRHLQAFAEADRFDATAVALSLICDMPIGGVERALVYEHSDQLLVLAKSADLPWPAVRAILTLQAASRREPLPDFDRCRASYGRLKVETARTAIKFYRLRAQAIDTASLNSRSESR